MAWQERWLPKISTKLSLWQTPLTPVLFGEWKRWIHIWQRCNLAISKIKCILFCVVDTIIHSQQTQNICITFVQRRPNVFDVDPTLYKYYTKCLLFTRICTKPNSKCDGKSVDSEDEHILENNFKYVDCFDVLNVVLMFAQCRRRWSSF